MRAIAPLFALMALTAADEPSQPPIDGRYNILLKGECRVRLEQELPAL